MASGSAGGGYRREGGGRTSGGGTGRRYTAAQQRRVNERYTTVNRSTRRSIRGGVNAVPSRWYL